MSEGIILNDEKVISTIGGDIRHIIKKSSKGFKLFGEAYFSNIEHNYVKAWKMHQKMTLNIVVPSGKIKFVFVDDLDRNNIEFHEYILSSDINQRITVPPRIWMGFQGLSPGISTLLNIADLEHDAKEFVRKPLDFFDYNWC